MTSLLLDRRRLLIDDSHHMALMLVTIISGGAIYGAALGSWHGARLSLYVAAKIPILLISTAVVTAFFNFVSASLLGWPQRFRQIFSMTLLPLALAALAAASVAPALWLFSASLPPPSPAQRTLHNLLYLVHVGVIATAGYAGTSRLGESLAELTGSRAVARRIRFAWIAAYAFVGGEIAWILRPFVGSVYLPVEFIRDDAMRGNIYEFIVTDILPHLLEAL
jgi:hypothetical protein